MARGPTKQQIRSVTGRSAAKLAAVVSAYGWRVYWDQPTKSPRGRFHAASPDRIYWLEPNVQHASNGEACLSWRLITRGPDGICAATLPLVDYPRAFSYAREKLAQYLSSPHEKTGTGSVVV
jgi:hypothetical protein